MSGGASPARITVYPDGPLVVRGDVVVELLDEGTVSTGRTVALCRCGRSATKPLCDGSHKRARGKRSSAAGSLRPALVQEPS